MPIKVKRPFQLFETETPLYQSIGSGLSDIISENICKKRCLQYEESARKWGRSGRSLLEWFYEVNILARTNFQGGKYRDIKILKGIDELLSPKPTPELNLRYKHLISKESEPPTLEDIIKEVTELKQLTVNRKTDYVPDGRKAKCKPVYQYYSQKGGFIKEYESVTEASIQLTIPRANISSCLHHRLKSAGGYYFTYNKIETETQNHNESI